MKLLQEFHALLQELHALNEEQLDEGMWRNLIAAAAMLVGSSHMMSDVDIDKSQWKMPSAVAKGLAKKKQQVAKQNERKNFITTAVEKVTSKYRVDPKLVQQIASTAVKYAHPDFPTAKDILGVVGTESSFNPKAVSQLKKDPAVGLMQIRPGVWGLKPEQLQTIDDQIKHGAEILRTYYKKLGSREAALHAYNVGITNHRTGKVVNPRYVPKVNYHKSMFEAFEDEQDKRVENATLILANVPKTKQNLDEDELEDVVWHAVANAEYGKVKFRVEVTEIEWVNDNLHVTFEIMSMRTENPFWKSTYERIIPTIVNALQDELGEMDLNDLVDDNIKLPKSKRPKIKLASVTFEEADEDF